MHPCYSFTDFMRVPVQLKMCTSQNFALPSVSSNSMKRHFSVAVIIWCYILFRESTEKRSSPIMLAKLAIWWFPKHVLSLAAPFVVLPITLNDKYHFFIHQCDFYFSTLTVVNTECCERLAQVTTSHIKGSKSRPSCCNNGTKPVHQANR